MQNRTTQKATDDSALPQDRVTHSVQSTNLADIIERILDKGIVIAGDIRIQIAHIDLLNIKIRLMVASVERAKEMGIDWWESDPYLSSKARELEEENRRLKERLDTLTKAIATQEG